MEHAISEEYWWFIEVDDNEASADGNSEVNDSSNSQARPRNSSFKGIKQVAISRYGSKLTILDDSALEKSIPLVIPSSYFVSPHDFVSWGCTDFLGNVSDYQDRKCWNVIFKAKEMRHYSW